MKTDVLDQPHHPFLWDNDILIRLNPWHTIIFYQCLVASLLDRVMHSFFVSLLLLVFCIDGQNFTGTMKCVPVHFLVLFVIADALCNTSFLYYIPKFQKGYCLWTRFWGNNEILPNVPMEWLFITAVLRWWKVSIPRGHKIFNYVISW